MTFKWGDILRYEHRRLDLQPRYNYSRDEGGSGKFAVGVVISV